MFILNQIKLDFLLLYNFYVGWIIDVSVKEVFVDRILKELYRVFENGLGGDLINV